MPATVNQLYNLNKAFDIDWAGAAKDVRVDLANHMLVQSSEDVFYLTFFELAPPAIYAADQESASKQIEGIRVLTPRCVARIAITPDMAQRITAAISTHYERFMSSRGTQDNGSE